MSQETIYKKTVIGGGMWSNVIGRGKTLKLTNMEGGANVGLLLYNDAQKTERYNMPDTLKGQHIFYLTSPYCLHSDMGRIMCSITNDTAGWHDTVCGCSSAASVKAKYGELNYQEARNDFHRNGRENFLIELGKWGLGKRDLVPNINLFSKVVSDELGNLVYVDESSKAGSFIKLYFEMECLVVLNTCQHPLDPNPKYEPKPVLIEVHNNENRDSLNRCRTSRPENERAFQNTEDYYALRS